MIDITVRVGYPKPLVCWSLVHFITDHSYFGFWCEVKNVNFPSKVRNQQQQQLMFWAENMEFLPSSVSTSWSLSLRSLNSSLGSNCSWWWWPGSAGGMKMSRQHHIFHLLYSCREQVTINSRICVAAVCCCVVQHRVVL